MLSRRALLSGIAVAGLLPVPGRAFGSDGALIFDPDLGKRNDIYAQTALPGRWQPFKRPVILKFDDLPEISDGEVPVMWVYCSPDVDQARLVVFSHDFMIEPQAYAPLFRFLTTHGFCVVAPVHTDSVLRDGASTQTLLSPERTSWQFDRLLKDREIWVKRANDCNRTLLHADYIANTISTALDFKTPIIMGHGMGAFTAQIILGAKVRTAEDDVIQFANKVWTGAVLFAPYGPGVLGLDEQSFTEVTAPFILMSGVEGRDLSEQTAQERAGMYFLAPSRYKHLNFFLKGPHSIYTGARAFGGTDVYRTLNDIQSATVLFLNAYTRFDETAFGALYSGEFNRRNSGLSNLQSWGAT